MLLTSLFKDILFSSLSIESFNSSRIKIRAAEKNCSSSEAAPWWCSGSVCDSKSSVTQDQMVTVTMQPREWSASLWSDVLNLHCAVWRAKINSMHWLIFFSHYIWTFINLHKENALISYCVHFSILNVARTNVWCIIYLFFFTFFSENLIIL